MGKQNCAMKSLVALLLIVALALAQDYNHKPHGGYEKPIPDPTDLPYEPIKEDTVAEEEYGDSTMYDTYYVYVPVVPIVVSFFIGVCCTLFCSRCVCKRKPQIVYQPLAYEQVYPLGNFAQQV